MTVGLLSFASVFPDIRVTLNVQADSTTFLNIAKAWFPTSGTALTGANTDANGYPTSALGCSGNISMRSGYYGQYVWKLTGKAAMQFPGLPAIIFSGGTFCGLGTATGSNTSNFGFDTTNANPRVAFKFGALVTAISGGNGSPVLISTASLNFGAGLATGSSITFNQGCSSNLIAGPNLDGSWTITNVSGTQFTLNSSTGVVSPTITTGGVVGTNTEAILGVSGPSLTWLNSGVYSSPTNLVICTLANETDITNGLIWDSAFVADVQALMGTSSATKTPGWLRFMDVTGVQGSWDQDFTQRVVTTQQCWTKDNQLPRPNYFVSGGLTRGAGSGAFSEVYSCTPPAASPVSGAPVDGETIQGAVSATNTGGTPALTMSGRTGTWPIISTGQSWYLHNASGASGAGVAISVVFTASWLSGGTYTFPYTTVSGDTNQSTFGANLKAALDADATLKAAKFVFTYDDMNKIIGIICPTALADVSGGMVRMSYSGPAALTLNTVAVGSLSSTLSNTLVFSSLQGAFINIGVVVYCPPFEAVVELCNRTGNNCWYNWQVYTQRSYITAVTNFLAQPQASGGLASNLKFGGEVGNEMWNFGLAPWGRAQAFGIALGLFTGTYGGNEGPYGWTALKTIEYSGLSKAAWTAAGRSASNHYTLMMSQVDDITISGNWDLSAAKGQFLTTSIASYASFGGANFGSTSTSHNTSGSYPVDIADAIGMAPYWASNWLAGESSDHGGGGVSINGTVVENAPVLQAALDFANGNTATAFTAMFSMFNGSTLRSSGFTGGLNLGVDYLTRFTTLEATAAQHDSARTGRGQTKLAIMHYEGGPQWAPGANFNNGVNSVDCLAASLAANDVADLAFRIGVGNGSTIAGLFWDVSAYTQSGTNNATEMATEILTMCQGWKYDTDHLGAPANTGSYQNLVTTYYYQQLQSVSGIHREARGAQYGVWSNAWGLYYSSWLNGASGAYKNRAAFAGWNA